MLGEGYDVQVAADASASYTKFGDDLALRRMERAGAVIMTHDQLISELAVDWSTPLGRRWWPTRFGGVIVVMYHPSMKQKMTGLEARKTELIALLANEPTTAPDLLPSAANIYAGKVAALSRPANRQIGAVYPNPRTGLLKPDRELERTCVADAVA